MRKGTELHAEVQALRLRGLDQGLGGGRRSGPRGRRPDGHGMQSDPLLGASCDADLELVERDEDAAGEVERCAWSVTVGSAT